EQRIDNRAKPVALGSELDDPWHEAAPLGRARRRAKRIQRSAELVLDAASGLQKLLPRKQHGPNELRIERSHPCFAVPAHAHEIGQPASIIALPFGRAT